MLRHVGFFKTLNVPQSFIDLLTIGKGDFTHAQMGDASRMPFPELDFGRCTIQVSSHARGDAPCFVLHLDGEYGSRRAVRAAQVLLANEDHFTFVHIRWGLFVSCRFGGNRRDLRSLRLQSKIAAYLFDGLRE